MKIHEYNQMMKYLTRREPRKVLEEKVKKELNLPKDAKVSGSKILNWVNYNNKVHGNNTQPITEEEKQVAKDIEAYKYPPAASDLQMANLKKRIENARAYVTKPRAYITKPKEKWHYTSWADQQEPKMVDLLPLPPEPKKVLVAKKPKPIKPITPLDPLYDWRLAPWYDYPEDDDAKPEEDKTRLKKKKKKKTKEGITSLI